MPVTLALVLAALVLGAAPIGNAHPIAVRSITLTRTGGFVAHNDRATVTRRRPAQLRRIAALLPTKLPSKHTLPVCPDCFVETLTVVRGRSQSTYVWSNSPPASLRRVVAELTPLLRPA